MDDEQGDSLRQQGKQGGVELVMKGRDGYLSLVGSRVPRE